MRIRRPLVPETPTAKRRSRLSAGLLVGWPFNFVCSGSAREMVNRRFRLFR